MSKNDIDLSALTSFSPQWSPSLRFATAIAVRYAAFRCVERINALAEATSTAGRDSPTMDEEDNHAGEVGADRAETSGIGRHKREKRRKEFKEDWADYAEKFVTATCQHLGVPRDALPPGENTLEEILTASQGSAVEEEKPNHAEGHRRTYETGSALARLQPNAVVLSDAAPSQSDTPATASISTVAKSSSDLDEIEEQAAALSVEKGQEQSQLKPENEEQRESASLPSYLRAWSRGTEQQPSQPTKPTEKYSAPAPGPPPPARVGGALDNDRNIEVVHELVLIALGLGQYRGEDGTTTIFEQDALFGDVGPRTAAGSEVDEEPITVASAETTPANAPPLPPRPSTDTSVKARETQDVISQTSSKAWGAIKGGAISGWTSVSSATQGVADSMRSSTQSSDSPEERRIKKSPKPVKPNEICHFDARARAIIFVASTSMGIQGRDVWMGEKAVAQSIFFLMSEGRQATGSKGQDPLQDVPKGGRLDPQTGRIVQRTDEDDEGDDDDNSRKAWMNSASNKAVEKDKKANWGRWAATGAGFVLGGVAIGLTGGLAAPVLAPALVGLTGASFLASGAGIVLMGTLLGLGGGGLAGYRVRRRLRGIDNFEFVEVRTVAHEAGMAIPSLHATIAVSGLLLQEEDQVKPWQEVLSQTIDKRDAYVVRFETAMMVEAGIGLKGYVMDQMLKSGGQRIGTEIIKHTALAGFAALTLPLTVMGAASATLDGCFVRAKTKAYKAGLVLADTLRQEVQGHRPVVLIGSSLGCYTILSALLTLAETPAENAHLVDSVILVGAPVAASTATWKRARSVVGRRFVNAHSTRDMVSAIAAWLGSGMSVEELRAGRMPRVAGSRAILGVPGLENVDVTDMISSHFELNDSAKLASVLERCGALEE